MDVLDEEVKDFQLKLEAVIEVYGNLKIVITSFDRPSRIAFLEGNTIYVNIKARRYPDFVLRYMLKPSGPTAISGWSDTTSP